jgi:hypothetical protein
MELKMFNQMIAKIESEDKGAPLCQAYKAQSKLYKSLLDSVEEPSLGHSKDTGHCKFSRSGGGGHGNVCYPKSKP